MTVDAVPAQQVSPWARQTPMNPQFTDNMPDPGYGSQYGSPDAQSSKPPQSTINESKGRPLLAPLAHLAEFDKAVDDATLSRFQDVHRQIEHPLLNYVRRKRPREKYRPMAVRLMVLGSSEETAKPCIVILCSGQQAKVVRKFFYKDSVGALCRPADEGLPLFEVFVIGRPLEMKWAGDDINVLLPIIQGESHVSFSTLSYSLGEDEIGQAEKLQLSSTDTDGPWTSPELSKVGSIAQGTLLPGRSIAANSESKGYYDWALIDMLSYRPNRVQPRQSSSPKACDDGILRSRDLVMAVPSGSAHKRQSVLVLTASEGPKRGSLSALSSKVLLSPGRVSVNALVVNLDNSKQIVDGDSGSWVVNEKTLEVYGYIVASDPFGGGHIIPMAEALEDIKVTIGLGSVTLASSFDVATAELSRQINHGFNVDPAPTLRQNINSGNAVDNEHGGQQNTACHWPTAVDPYKAPDQSLPVKLQEDLVQESLHDEHALLLLKPEWKRQGDKLGLLLQYRLSLSVQFTAPTTLHNVVIVARYEGKASGAQTKPSGTHLKDKRLVYWRLGDITPTVVMQKVMCRIVGADGVAPTGGLIEARWDYAATSHDTVCSGISISMLEETDKAAAAAEDDPFVDQSADGAGPSTIAQPAIDSGDAHPFEIWRTHFDIAAGSKPNLGHHQHSDLGDFDEDPFFGAVFTSL
ncbi:hypothetical protein HRG_000266 [Hirsutella rhossiliensis]|uniref:Muniscin C-terminal domain-containing protein n=1 Tax=Hirsutella rhossiliensis TaxID=111463 RepID=A0A9P8SMS9_9HYPO|nr:uncharacterized protein HRG_00266 [Hirsutella rhossiliensis]KAH0967624.1 hypothetical protein HRG_00266 [Hirsutella rhossiliensis]